MFLSSMTPRNSRVCSSFAPKSAHSSWLVQGLLQFAALILVTGVSLAGTTINHQFLPASITPGDNSVYTITVANDSLHPLTAADVTVLFPSSVTIASTPGITNTCGFTENSIGSGDSKVYLTNGTIPAGDGVSSGSCYFRLNVTSVIPGNKTITIPANTTPNSTTSGYTALELGVSVFNATDASATLGVDTLTTMTASKDFSPASIVVGATSRLRIILTNPNAAASIPLTSLTDNLPSGMLVASTPAPTVSCTGSGGSNGTLTAISGVNSIELTGGAIGRSGTCTISVNVVVASMTAGVSSQSLTNSVASGAVGNTRGLTSPAFSNSITITSPIDVTKSFATSPISAGQESLMTIRISNSSTVTPLVINNFVDNLTGTTFKVINTSSTPIAATANPSVVCTGTSAVNGTLTAPADLIDQTITLSGATVGTSGNCTITAYVTSNSNGSHTNSIPQNAIENPNGFYSPPISASLTANAELTVTKTTSYTSVAPGQWTKYTVAVSNWAPGDVNNINFTDILPSPNGKQMTLYDAGQGLYAVDSGCSGGNWYGTNAAGTSTGLAPTAGDAGITWTDGTIPDGFGLAKVCNISIWAKMHDTATAGTYTNTIPVGSITGDGPEGAISNTNQGAVGVNYIAKAVVQKAFTTPIVQGGQSTMTLNIINRVITPLTAVNLTDNFPSGIRIAAIPATTNNCGGTLQAFPGDTVLKLIGGTVAARPAAPTLESSCTITVKVTGVSLGTYTNTIHAEDFSNNEGVPISDVSANLVINTGLSGTKTFTPSAVKSGGTARVKITLSNAYNSSLSNVSVDDNTFSTGLTVANPANAATSCSGSPTMVVNPGSTRAQLQGVALAVGSSCDFSFDVVTSGVGPWSNTIPIGNITSAEGLSNTATVTRSLTVGSAQININKAFNPVMVSGGIPSVLQIDVSNPTAVNVTGLGFTDTFPVGMEVYSVPNASTTCTGGTLTAVPGDGKIILSGASLNANTTCYIYVTTTSFKLLNVTNTIPANSVVTSQGYTNPTLASATLSTLQGLNVIKSFSPAYVAANQVSSLKMRLVSTYDPNAPSPVTVTGVTYTDTMPAGVLVADTPNASTTCAGSGPGGKAVITTSNNGTTNGIVTVSQATVPPNTNCLISVDVKAASLGSYTNNIPIGAMTSDQAISNTIATSAVLKVVTTPTVSKTFTNATRNPGVSNKLTITVTNGSSVEISGVALTDTLPTGLAIASTPNAGTTCTYGSTSANAGGTTISLSGATIAAGGNCTFYADTVANSPGTYINNINASSITTNQGLTNAGSAQATTSVNNAPTITKAFNPVAISAGARSLLSISIGNSNSGNITLSSALIDVLPGNIMGSVVIDSTPGASSTCSATGTITATAGSGSITVSSATIQPGGCTISVYVTSTTAGTYTNTIAAGQLSTSTGVNQLPAVAVLAVGPGALVPPTMSKIFNPSTILSAGTSRLTITLGNPNASALTLSSAFTDALPANVVIASSPNLVKSCPGAVTATGNSGSVIYASGATIPSGGCTIAVDVTSSTAGSYTNSLATSALVTNGGSPVLPATAGLVIQAPVLPMITKTFYPSTINVGATSRLTITLGNTNASAITLTNILTDTLPANVTVAATPGVSKSCSGTVTATAGSSSITYASGSSIPSGGCTISVNVTSSTTGGPYTNTIAVNALQTNVGNNSGAAVANLFVNPPQAPSINKFFSPTEIVTGGTSTLRLLLSNENLAGTTLTFDLVDTLTGGLKIAAVPNLRVSSGCSLDKVAATAGGTTLTYQTGGAVPAGGCSVYADVTSTVGTIHTNTIAIAALKTGYGNNAVATSANLKIKIPPTLSKSFSRSSIRVENDGTATLTLNLGNPNDYTINLTSPLVDTFPAELVLANPATKAGTCTTSNVQATAGGSTVTYVSGATIPPGGCTITVPVIAASRFTAPATYQNYMYNALHTDAGTSGSGSAFITITPVADLAVTKTVTPASPTLVAYGANVTFHITVNNNLGPSTANPVWIHDTLPTGYNFVSASSSQGSFSRTSNYDGSSYLLWNVGSLAYGASATFDVVATVKTYGQFANTASIQSSGAFDPVSGNNSATVTPYLPARVACDVNRDQKINVDDITLIMAGRNSQTNALDPRDLNNDSWITINDTRGCVLHCDYATCALFPRALQSTAYTSEAPLAFLAPTGSSTEQTFVVTGSLPAGIIYSSSTGKLTGTPSVTGNFPFNVTVTDADGNVRTDSYTLYVDPPFEIATTLPGATVGSPYSQTIVTGGLAPYECTVTSGTLPAWLSLNPATCVLSGTPTSGTNGQTTSFTVQALEYNSRIISQALSITVN